MGVPPALLPDDGGGNSRFFLFPYRGRKEGVFVPLPRAWGSAIAIIRDAQGLMTGKGGKFELI